MIILKSNQKLTQDEINALKAIGSILYANDQIYGVNLNNDIPHQEEILIEVDNELHQTVKGMISDDYKDRFKAEYKQLIIRLEKLEVIINKAKDKSLEFTLSCPLKVLETQAWYMKSYAEILRNRAGYEGINLD